MTFTVIYAGGLLIGLTFRAPFLAAASFLTVIAGVLLTVVADWGLFASVLYCVSLLVTLQIGYLVGGALACARGGLRFHKFLAVPPETTSRPSAMRMRIKVLSVASFPQTQAVA